MILVKLLHLSLKFPHPTNGQNNITGILLLEMLIEMPYWIKEMITIEYIKYNFI